MHQHILIHMRCGQLESLIQEKTLRNKVHIIRQLVMFEYYNDQNMTEHLNMFKSIVNKSKKI